MQTLQLYIQGKRVDLFSDESVNVTQSIQNIKDISKIFTDFSRSFVIPASKTNNKIFKHYNNKNIVDGFDARNKVESLLEINNKPFREGKVKLDGVNLKNGVTDSYKITFFGNTVNLKDILVDYKLETLGWLDNFSLDYSAAAVKDALENGKQFSFEENIYEKAIVAPLITNTTRLIYDSVVTYESYPDKQGGNLFEVPTYDALTHSGVYFEELKYAIRIHLIVKAIQEEYGLVFSEDFFNETNKEYHDLYLWLHRDKGRAFEGNAINTLAQPFTPGDVGRVRVESDRVLVFNGDFGSEIFYTLNVETNLAANFKVTIKKDGVTYKSTTVENGDQVSLQGVLQSSSTGYKVYIESEDVFTFTVTWDILDNQNAGADGQFAATDVAMNTVRQFIITEQVPNMKIIDFLTGLFKTFNLTAYQKDGVIVIDTLDSYYSKSKVVWAIDEWVNTDKETVDNAIPFSEVDFKFKGDNTFLSKKHTNSFSQEWGELRYTSEDGFLDSSPNIYKIEIPFEHMKFERLLDSSNNSNTAIQYGWFVDDNTDTYVGEPLLFYPVSNTGTNIQFLNNETFVDSNSRSIVSNYFIASNSLAIDPSVSTSNLNFYLQANEYTFNLAFTNTLFRKYYSRYINNIFDIRNRLTKVNAFLPLNFLLKYQLNDKIRLRGNYYKINAINSDLVTGKADIELINDYDFVETITENGDEGTGGEIPVPPEGELPCPNADSTFFTVDTIDMTADRNCNESIPIPEPEPDPEVPACNLSMFSSTSTTTSEGLACGLSYTRSLWHTGNTTYPQVGDKIHADANCDTFIEDGFVKVTDENTTIEVLRTSPNLYSTVISKSSCVTDYKPTVTTNAASANATSATLNGTITNVGSPNYTERGFYYIQGTGDPLQGTRLVFSSTSSGSFNTFISGLTTGVTYSYVAFATNAAGTAYGSVVQFVTSVATYAPSVITLNADGIGATSAVMNGQITDVGNPNYETKGFYWAQGTGTPSASDNIRNVSGTTSGTYYSALGGLNVDTTYVYRSFATNSIGTDLGVVKSFTTINQTCNGGTLRFNKGTLSGAAMSLSTHVLPYTDCGSIYTLDMNLINNATGEWNSTSEVTSITVFEGSTNVTSQFSISKILSSGVIIIRLINYTPSVFEVSDHTYTVNVTASPSTTYQTDITVTQNVDNTSLTVTDAQGNVVGPNSHTVIAGAGKTFAFYYTYTADSGYNIGGLGVIQNLVANGVNAEKVSYTSTTVVVKISGTIGVSNQSATVSWNGAASASTATSATLLFRYGTSGAFLTIPAVGIEVSSQQVVQIQVTPNGGYYVALGNNNAIKTVTPTTVYGGAQTIHTLEAQPFTGGEGKLKTAFRVYPSGSTSSLATAVLFFNGGQ